MRLKNIVKGLQTLAIWLLGALCAFFYMYWVEVPGLSTTGNVTEALKQEMLPITPIDTAETVLAGEPTLQEQLVYNHEKNDLPIEDLKPNTIYYGNYQTPFKNGGKEQGQWIIDTTEYAATWGGNPVFNALDNKNTHFIGHEGKQFTDIQKAKWIQITDEKGVPHVYQVVQTILVYDNGVGVKDGVSYLEQIVGEGTEELVTLQTCVDDDINWIVQAKRVD